MKCNCASRRSRRWLVFLTHPHILLLLSIRSIRPLRGCNDRIEVSRWGLFVLFIFILLFGYSNRRSRWGLVVLFVLIFLLLFLKRVDEVDEHVIASQRSRWGLMMLIVIVVCCCRWSLLIKLKSLSRAFDEYIICIYRKKLLIVIFIVVHFLVEKVPPSKELSMSIQLVVFIFF